MFGIQKKGPSAKKSTSFETLVIQNIENVCDLKAKLNEIISSGKSYEYDVSSCLKALLKNNDQIIVLLTVQAISELAKCEIKREFYAEKDVIVPILSLLNKELSLEKIEVYKQCCRALGNLCCDCDTARKIILQHNGVETLNNVLGISIRDKKLPLGAIKLFACKTLLNYAIGGLEFSESLVKGGVIDTIRQILSMEAERELMEDDLVSTVLLILSVVNDNDPEFLYEEQVNLAVFQVLKETTNVEVSELCFEHLHTQAEHDSVKTLLAKEGRVKLVCLRIEQLLQKHEAGNMNMEDSEIDTVMKHACDLIIIVLTGDEAMDILYAHGKGEVYRTMVRWLDSTNYQLLATAVLAVGNFARRDQHCAHMMNDHIFDKLLDIFEQYYSYSIPQSEKPHSPDKATVTKVQHAALSALRNLTVPVANKRLAAEQGRAAPMLISALPNVEDQHVAYKLLAAVRMLVDGQEEVAKQVACNVAALRGVAKWGGAGGAGAAAEAPRLLAWTVRLIPRDALLRNLLLAEGCVSCLVNMLVASHSVMQNEAILALTLLAVAPLNDASPTKDRSEVDFNAQLIKSEIGKHISVLIDTNCSKMPTQVAENLITFLDITSKDNTIVSDYKDAKVNVSLQKFVESRNDLSDDMKACVSKIIKVVSDKE
ncbi:rap1 GTPase-GDP dissociation stimulator 1-B isoform X1 [Maniola jurtina]|uniref:rap1 GTPase-GDP dissociation stimulator 1-B isoform X1 n=1 Tax=Maniola jurtina TaxID=191418 RepID=UPI001E689440|nr:rap1 GTPase-GDP dissociation stimulator 1-B isoform X1 [Maniola jurtina]